MKTRASVLVLPLIAALALAGCEKKSASNDKGKSKTTVAQVEEGQWCAEHGVPESICTRCHPNLIAGFKQKGDWCDKHNLPKSQCVECDPSLKAKFEAMAPRK
jgi:cobalt-zinc-cadmium efflux system membrane fusion protein